MTPNSPTPTPEPNPSEWTETHVAESPYDDGTEPLRAQDGRFAADEFEALGGAK